MTIQQIRIRANVPSKGSLNGGRTVSTILLCVSQIPPASPILSLSCVVVSHRHGHKGLVHANTSARIDSVTSAVITNGLRRKSNEWVFYEFRGDSVVRREKQRENKRETRGNDEEGRAGDVMARCDPNI